MSLAIWALGLVTGVAIGVNPTGAGVGGGVDVGVGVGTTAAAGVGAAGVGAAGVGAGVAGTDCVPTEGPDADELDDVPAVGVTLTSPEEQALINAALAEVPAILRNCRRNSVGVVIFGGIRAP